MKRASAKTNARSERVAGFQPPQRTAIRRALLAWYRRHRRDLPWRRTRDPYAIWLSEVLLQQTRVEAARPYYERFLERFPTIYAIAEAPLDDVLTLWSGLGYYARGRNLHRAACVIVDQHDGAIPSNYEDLLTLPGVGRYTAAAVASIAFDQPVAAVDGNIKRVLARLAIIRAPIDNDATVDRLQRIGDELLARRAPGDFNQALMELGATVCLPRNPRCLTCPLHNHCRAAIAGAQSDVPQRRAKRPPAEVRAAAAAIWRGGKLLLVQRPPAGLLGGMWELPGTEIVASTPIEAQLAAALCERFGVKVEVQAELGAVEHVFTHRRLRARVWQCFTRTRRPQANHHARIAWIAPDEFGELPIATVDRKIIRCAIDGRLLDRKQT